MKTTKLLLTVFCLLKISIFSINAQDRDKEILEIRFQPDSMLYVYENRGPEMPKQLFSAVIQNMAFVNKTEESLILQDVVVHALSKENIVQSNYILTEKIKTSAAKYKMLQHHGVLQLYDFQFQTSRYLKDVKLASSDTIKGHEAIIITHETMLFEDLPDQLEISATVQLLNGQNKQVSKRINVVNHKGKNNYILPLKGIWTAASGPSLIGHHRWGSIQEFAFDFIQIGTDQLSYKGDGLSLEDYYAYGETVYAVADGVVVSALDGITESSDNLKRPDESESDYLQRMRPYQEELMARGLKYVSGNHVVIRHANNEYSSYFHLKNESVTVQVGDVIQQGQIIGQLGHSGNSTEPHLHFHLSDGEDMAYSRSIPIEFNNVVLFPVDSGAIRHIHSGQIIRTKE